MGRTTKEDVKKEICICGHEKRFHADPSNHNLKTSHCTAWAYNAKFCDCEKYEEE